MKGRRGARGFGSYWMNCRFGLRLPGTSARVWAYRIGTSREHAAPRKPRSKSYEGQIVRCHPRSCPDQNRVGLGTGNSRQSGAECSGWGGTEAAATLAQLCFNVPHGVGLGTRHSFVKGLTYPAALEKTSLPSRSREWNRSAINSARTKDNTTSQANAPNTAATPAHFAASAKTSTLIPPPNVPAKLIKP